MSNKIKVGGVYENPLDEEVIRVVAISGTVVHYEVVEGGGGKGMLSLSFAEKNLICVS